MGESIAWIWLPWLVTVLVIGIVTAGSPRALEYLEYPLIFLHLAFVSLMFARNFPPWLALLLVSTLLLRVLLMLWDLNFSQIATLPNSGRDSEMFYARALEIAGMPELLTETVQGGVYSKIIAILFMVTGPARVIAQYANVLAGISMIVLIYGLSRLLTRDPEEAPGKRLQFSMVAIAFFPTGVILSALLLRESLIAALVTWSVYGFVRWIVGLGSYNAIWALLPVLLASTLHAGVIAIGLGYAIVLIFYSPQRGRFGLTSNSFNYVFMITLVAVPVLLENPDLFLGKFAAYDDSAALIDRLNSRRGGSAYLTGIEVNSLTDMLLFGPLKAVYFLASPMLWGVRGAADLVAIATDSVLYVGVLWIWIRRRATFEGRYRLFSWR